MGANRRVVVGKVHRTTSLQACLIAPASWLVEVQHRSSREGCRSDNFEMQCIRQVLKHRLAPSISDGLVDYGVLIDETFPVQCSSKAGTAPSDDLPSRLLLERADLRGKVSACDGGLGPSRVRERL